MTDYITQGSTRLWALFAASPTFTAKVRPGNQLKFITGVKWPEKLNRNAGDWPEARLRTVRSQAQGYTGQNAMKTFGNTAPGTSTTFDFVAEKVVTYELILTYDGVDEALAGQLETEVESILYNAGINLGLAKVKTWGPIDCRTEQKSNATKSGSPGVVQTILIPVTFRLHRADIITP